VLTGDGGVVTSCRTGGSEWRRLELVVSAKELGREGMRCGEIRGSHRPFIGVGGAPSGPSGEPAACGAAQAGLGRMGRNLKKIPFRIKIKFLNIPRLWKFAQGDLGGILT
jgi:hypothetical protein